MAAFFYVTTYFRYCFSTSFDTFSPKIKLSMRLKIQQTKVWKMAVMMMK